MGAVCGREGGNQTRREGRAALMSIHEGGRRCFLS